MKTAMQTGWTSIASYFPKSSPEAAATMEPRVWFVTGTSSGLGRRLVTSVLARGDYVIATARSIEKIKDFPPSDSLRLLELDVDAGEAAIQAKVHEAVAFWGRIDVLVNNAGISVRGLFEESGSAQFKKQFQTNVFSVIDVTTAVLPHMRARRSGTVVMIGSRSSWFPNKPAMSLYTASKAAVRTFSEGLAIELEEFSIRVLIVEPGMFRTEGIFSTPFYAENPISDYDEMRKASMKRFDTGNFKGDPAKGMDLLVDVVRGEGKAAGKPWPLYLIMGPGSEESVRGKCEIVMKVLDEWREVTKGLEFDEEDE